MCGKGTGAFNYISHHREGSGAAAGIALGYASDERCRIAHHLIGELDLVLGNVEGSKGFEDLLREAWSASTSDADLATRIDALGDLLARARRDYERVRQNNQMLDSALDL